MTDREKAQEIKEASKEAFKIQNREQEMEKTYSVVSNNTASNESYIEKLKSLQEQLKIEIQKNPEIQLTDEYKKIQEKYEQMIKSTQNTEEGKNENEDRNEENIKLNKIADINEEKETNENIEETEKFLVKEEKPESIENIEENFEIKDEINKNEIIQEDENLKEINDEIQINEENNIVKEDEEIVNETYKENEHEVVEIEKDVNIKPIEESTDIQEKEENENIKQIEENTNTQENENTEEIDENTNNQKIEEDKGSKLKEAKEKILSFEEMYKELFGKEPYGGRKQPEENEKKNYYTIDTEMEESNLSMFEDDKEYDKLQYKFIGIAFNTYIILEIENELYIMDQHAAHERIMYEKVKKNFYEVGEKSSQLLLLPDIIELTNREMDIAKDNFDLFRQAGFTLEEFGENTIKLSGVPEVCIDLNTRDLFKETLDEVNTVARTAKQEKEEKFIATVACKAAVKANMKLEKEEVDKLMEELLKLPNPFTCPHGRPTVIKMSKYEIERKFARK